jgi:hypothetical protein
MLHITNNQLISRIRSLLEKLTGLRLLKNSTYFMRPERSLRIHKRPPQLSLPWARSVQFKLPHPGSRRSILILFSDLRLRLPSVLFPISHSTLTTAGHRMCIWTRGCKYSLELLIMSGIPLETCWAFNKLWNNKLYYKVASGWLFLLIHTVLFPWGLSTKILYAPPLSPAHTRAHTRARESAHILARTYMHAHERTRHARTHTRTRTYTPHMNAPHAHARTHSHTHGYTQQYFFT